jgi:hypothetical protein
VQEDDAARLRLGEALLDGLPGPPLHRLAHLGAEACLAEHHWVARHRLPIEPRRTLGRHLVLDCEIGTHSERHAPPPLRVVELAQLDDRSRRAIASGVEIGKQDVMGAPVDAV